MRFASTKSRFHSVASFCLVLAAAAVWLLAAGRAAHAEPPEDLTAADILRTVREAQAGRYETLEGDLRADDGRKLPFRLAANGPVVRYDFASTPPISIQVHYNGDNSQLEESGGGTGSERMTPANFDKKILGTDLTYEDLALRFVYWKRATLLESDDETNFPAYKLRLNSPSRQSQYSYVLVWVAKESGALLRAEGYNADGKLSKRLRVVSGQKINGKWYLKSLSIENVDPESGSTRSRSYLEIKGVARPPAGTVH